MTSLLEEGLTLVVAGTPRSGRTKPVLPPISRAHGGTLPGVDLTKPAALEEQEDLERVRAMICFVQRQDR